MVDAKDMDFSGIDDLLDDEGWDILNGLTEDELAMLNSDFDPENMLIPTGERINHDIASVGALKSNAVIQEVKPMFTQADLVATMDSLNSRFMKGHKKELPDVNSTLDSVTITEKEGVEHMFDQRQLVESLNKMVAASQEAGQIQNERIREKDKERRTWQKREEEKKIEAEKERKKKEEEVVLTNEEEELLAGATEEELVEAAALLNMNDILTSEQINAVFAGDKPEGSMKSSVKSSKPKQARITKADVETELDVIELNKQLKSDSDALFYLCVNNQPLLERETLELIIHSVATSKKIKHLSLSMIGITDKMCIALSQAIEKCTQLETLNLDSNVIGMPGIEALMKVVSEHPSLREVKCSNQKQPFGGQGEECMASAITKNQNILKFGYSFRQAAPRNKADRAIIKNNELMRQKRKNGEEVYDLKAVCKKRDPWPQPWIKVKGQRQLGSQLADKVTDMGLMIDPDQDVGRESRGLNVREEREAKPLDIAALLAARASKLKGTNVGNLEKEAEERRKKTLLAMKQSEEEHGRIGTMMKVTPGVGQPKEDASPTLNATETAPPTDDVVKKEENGEKKEEVKPVEPPKVEEKKDEPKKDDEDEEEEEEESDGDEESDDEEDEEAKRKEVAKKKKEEEAKKKKEEEAVKKRKEEEDAKKKKEEEEKKKAAAPKIAPLQPETNGPIRRRKKSVDEPTPALFEEGEKPKLSAAEERAKALRERREALAARKAAAETKSDQKPAATPVAAPAAAPAPTPAPASTEEKPLSAAEQRAKALRERREALEAKKAASASAPAPAAAKPEIKAPEPESDKPLSLKERRALLAEKKRLLGK